MRDKEIEKTITRPETPKFNALVNREVSLTKFAACCAQSIMIAANQSGISCNDVIHRVSTWVALLQKEKINLTSPFDEGSDNDVK